MESLIKELESLRAQVERQGREISRCIEIERSLRESEEKYRFLVENSKDIIWKIDLQGRWTFVSSNVEKVVGYRPDEVIGRTIWDFIAPEYHGLINEKLQERVHGEEIPPYEVEIVTKDGRHVPFEVVTTTIVDKGKVVGVQGISRDIAYRREAEERLKKAYLELETRVRERTSELTEANRKLQKEIGERRVTERALRESEQKFRAIFDQTYQFIGLMAVDGTFLDVNRAALELIGAKKSDVIGKPFWETPWWAHSPGLRETLRTAVKRAAAGEFVRFEASHYAADGSLHYIDFSLKPVIDGSGRIVLLIPEGRDITQRRLIEDSLRESEEKFRVLAETSAAAIFVYQSLRFVTVNQAAVRITGYSKDELLTMSITDFIHPDFKKMVYERGRARQRGEPVPARYELKIITKAGDEKWVELTAGRIMYQGRPAVVATLFDITERKHAEEAARLTKFVVDNFIDPSIWLNPEGHIVYVNKASCRALGYSRDELLSMSVWDIDPDYPYEKFLEKWNETKAKGATSFETAHVRKDGSSFPVEISTVYLKFEDREYSVTFDRNITLRKQAEEAVRMSEARLAMAQAIAHLGSWDIDLATRSMAWSDELYRIYGVRPDEFKPSIEAVIDATHPDDREAFRRAFQRILSGPSPEIIEHRIVRPDGSIRLVRAEGKIVYDAGGKPVRIFGTAQDITEQKRARTELEEARAQAELYLDLMGHDINNSNQVALGYLELARGLLKSGRGLGEAELKLIDKPISSLQFSSKLIDKVMKLRSLRAKTLRLVRINLCDVLERLKDQYSHIAGRNITLNYVPAAECLVMANELIDDIFANLIENAIKHSPPDRPLTIDVIQSTVCENGRVFIRTSIEDNGPGIPDRIKERLFTRYFRGETKALGKGLGLYLVKMLVDDFHGRVWVEDRIPGDYTKGTRFVVMLPVGEY